MLEEVIELNQASKSSSEVGSSDGVGNDVCISGCVNSTFSALVTGKEV